MIIYEIVTIYKSGWAKTEYIKSANEESMWKHYDRHHNKSLIEDVSIVDAWIA